MIQPTLSRRHFAGLAGAVVAAGTAEAASCGLRTRRLRACLAGVALM